MTVVNHYAGGAALYGAIALAILEWIPCAGVELTWALTGAAMAMGGTIGAEPDTQDWLANKIDPATPRYGSLYQTWHKNKAVQKRWRWTLAIPLHLEIVDPVVHAEQTGLLPWKLPERLKDKRILFGITAWDIAYVLIEAGWYAVYAGVFVGTMAATGWLR